MGAEEVRICEQSVLKSIASNVRWVMSHYIYPFPFGEVDLNTAQLMIASLFYSLQSKDIPTFMRHLLIARHSANLQSTFLKVWLRDDFRFKTSDVRASLDTLASLVVDGVLSFGSPIVSTFLGLEEKYDLDGHFSQSLVVLSQSKGQQLGPGSTYRVKESPLIPEKDATAPDFKGQSISEPPTSRDEDSISRGPIKSVQPTSSVLGPSISMDQVPSASSKQALPSLMIKVPSDSSQPRSITLKSQVPSTTPMSGISTSPSQVPSKPSMSSPSSSLSQVPSTSSVPRPSSSQSQVSSLSSMSGSPTSQSRVPSPSSMSGSTTPQSQVPSTSSMSGPSTSQTQAPSSSAAPRRYTSPEPRPSTSRSQVPSTSSMSGPSTSQTQGPSSSSVPRRYTSPEPRPSTSRNRTESPNSEPLESENKALNKWLWDGIHKGDYCVVDRALVAGADPNSHDGDEWIPLHSAAQSGLWRIASILLYYGADVKRRNRPEWFTPLHLAAMWGKMDCVRMLLDWGADPNAKDRRGRTPYSYAKYQKHHAVASLIRFRGGT